MRTGAKTREGLCLSGLGSRVPSEQRSAKQWQLNWAIYGDRLKRRDGPFSYPIYTSDTPIALPRYIALRKSGRAREPLSCLHSGRPSFSVFRVNCNYSRTETGIDQLSAPSTFSRAVRTDLHENRETGHEPDTSPVSLGNSRAPLRKQMPDRLSRANTVLRRAITSSAETPARFHHRNPADPERVRVHRHDGSAL